MNQMHVIVISESVFHVENLLFPPGHIIECFFMCCILSVGPQDIKT